MSLNSERNYPDTSASTPNQENLPSYPSTDAYDSYK